MKPRISLLTLAVDDLDRALRFYRDGLGLSTPGIVGTGFEHGAVVFFDLQAGLEFALRPRASLAADTGLDASRATGVSASIGHNVGSRDEVDAVMAQAARAGADIVKPAQPTFWGGHAGCFRDPDGHLWDVAFNPAFVPSD